MIVLIGAGGFLGYVLASNLSKRKVNFATVSRSFQWRSLPYEHRYICSASDIFLHSRELSFDSVIYMAGSPDLVAAQKDPFGDLDLHYGELCKFLRCYAGAKSKHKKLLFLSSGGTVYGDSCGVAKIESSPLNPKSAYGTRNVVLEAVVRALAVSFDISTTILRVTNPFGPGQGCFRRRGLIQALLDSASSGEIVYIRGNGYQSRDYIHSSILCSMIFSQLHSENYFPVVNIGSGYSFTAREVVSFMNSNGISPSVEYIVESRDFEVIDSLVSCDLAATISGYSRESMNPLTISNLLSMIEFNSFDLNLS